MKNFFANALLFLSILPISYLIGVFWGIFPEFYSNNYEAQNLMIAILLLLSFCFFFAGEAESLRDEIKAKEKVIQRLFKSFK